MFLDLEDVNYELPEDFLEDYKTKVGDWGPLGKIVYKRTYSRLKDDGRMESWWETIKRVVEGVYTIQKRYCKANNFPWSEKKANNSAQEMYKRMFDFRFTPSGRGLWMMGTDFIFNRQTNAPLLNCAFISTKNITTDFAEPFVFLMDQSMHGVGTGFDTKGASNLKIKEPKEDKDWEFTVPDSREGWCESVGILLNGYGHKKRIPTSFDYSEIRPKGARLEGFGGTASGPDPLIQLHKDIHNILGRRVGDKIKSRDIVDLQNAIGRCVVAGGVRRSAEIALGDPDDKEFVDLKDYEKNPERAKWGWVSNNSVYADIGMDYSPYVDRLIENGEPGFVFMENIRNYARMGEEDDRDNRAEGVNPCFTGDTEIAVADGRDSVSLKKLSEEGEDVPVYSVDDSGNVSIKMGRNPRKTGEEREVYKINFKDGSSLKVTEDHEFPMLEGGIKEANELSEGDSLMRFTKNAEYMSQDADQQYYRVYTDVYDSKNGKFMEHRLIKKFFDGEKWEEMYNENKENGWHEGGLVVHHKDFDGLNNSLKNLELMTFKEHCKYHNSIETKGENNPRYKDFSNEEIREIAKDIIRLVGRRISVNEWKELADEIGFPKGPYNNFRSEDDLFFEHTVDLLKWASREVGVDYIDEDPRVVKTLFKMKESGYNSKIENGEVLVEKECEKCDDSFWISYNKREVSFCSQDCSNKWLNNDKELYEKRVDSIRNTYEEKKKEKRVKQARVYSELKNELDRQPLKKEWVEKCRENDICFRVGPKSPFRYWDDVVEAGENYNHTVESVEYVGREDVYNITVDDNHTVGVITNKYENKQGNINFNGVFAFQCGEQPLESGECCNLSETYPANHSSLDDWVTTLKYAYLYSKTVTLLPHHNQKTNSIMHKNRRIGCSVTGVTQSMNKFGRRTFFNYLKKGYNEIEKWDDVYSKWLCIPKSNRKTTVKPSGSVSRLGGSTSGIHYPISEYFIRNIRFQSDSNLLGPLKDAGYEIREDQDSDNTVIVSFPMHRDHVRKTEQDVTIWEQLENASSLQKYWSDNAVSQTVKFSDDEVGDLEDALEHYETKLKTVSFLPSNQESYNDAPYVPIDEEKYEELISQVDEIKFKEDVNTHEEEAEDKYCGSDKCEVDIED